MTEDANMCPAYEQISDRRCRYYEGHSGKHNFARLNHDSSLERDLRRALDEMTAARDEACHIAEQWIDKSFGPDVARLSELKSVGK